MQPLVLLRQAVAHFFICFLPEMSDEYSDRIVMPLSLSEYIMTGDFGFLRLGISKDELLARKFPPECWMNGYTPATSPIWRYGNFELHFDNRVHVSCIFNDYVPKLDGGESIMLSDCWIIVDSVAPTVIETQRSLNNMGIEFIRETDSLGQKALKLGTGISLVFREPDGVERPSPNEQRMFAIVQSLYAAKKYFH